MLATGDSIIFLSLQGLGLVVTGTLPVFNLTQDGPGEKKVRKGEGWGYGCAWGGYEHAHSRSEGGRGAGQACTLPVRAA